MREASESASGAAGKRAGARLSAGGYRRALGSVAARNARGIQRSNGRAGTSERVEQLMGRLPRRTPVWRTLSFPHASRRRSVLP